MTTNAATYDVLKEKIETNTALVGVIGLGYVGLPLAHAMHQGGLPVLGFDVDQSKIDKLATGENYLKHLGADFVSAMTDSDRFDATTDMSRLSEADAILDCLPGSQAPRMAQLARDHGCHYLNLTEYVAETNAVLEIAQGADTCFALQCGLAPGYINVLAHHLFQAAMSEWGATRAERSCTSDAPTGALV